MDLPQRKLQRLKGHNYAEANTYFVTLCTQNRSPFFGTIKDGIVDLNPAGIMVSERFQQLSQYNNTITIDEFILMPNHLHAILLIRCEEDHGGASADAVNGTTQRSFPTISACVKRFKTLTTKIYIDGVYTDKYPSFEKRIWQKSFHDHIIRNESEYHTIRQYIRNNPLKWSEDIYFHI